MDVPLILVNFKAYKEALGKNAIKLAKICRDVAKKYDVDIAVSPQFTDIKSITEIEIPVFAQHIDAVEVGAYTGHVTALAVKEAGVIGTLINHSERKLSLKEIKACIRLAKKYKLKTVCCSDSLMKSRKIVRFNPDFIAYEPPELIGTGISVSKVKPEGISCTVEMVKKINPKVKVLCGAGISTTWDVIRALELGTVGILVASAVVKVGNPKRILTDFAKVMKNYKNQL